MTTLVATPSALGLSMSNQRELRTSKRLAAAAELESDDDFQFVRKSKRPKTEEAQSTGRISGGRKTTRKSEETPTTTTTTTTTPAATISASEQSEPQLTPVATATKAQRRSSRRKGSQGQPREDEAAPPRTEKTNTRKSRRSATSEADGGMAAGAGNASSQSNGVDSQGQAKLSRTVRRWEPSPTPRRPTQSEQIALPMSDTPIINRNKEMRKKGGKSNRRSSLGSRGRRASSLIDNGQTATPHRDVRTDEFYKHIAAEGLPEPRRMKQLLMWCGERALPDKPRHGRSVDSSVLLGARAIQDEILKDFASRSDFSDWFSRDEEASNPAILKPNPRNTELDAKLAKLEANIKRLQDEKRAWLAIRQSPSDSAAPISADDATRGQPLEVDVTSLDLDLNLDVDLLGPEQGRIRSYLADEVVPLVMLRQETEERIRTTQASLEFQVDQLSDHVHKLEQFVLAAGRQADTVLRVSARRLRERERRDKTSAGTRDLSVMEVLRGLSALLPEEPSTATTTTTPGR